MKKGIRRKIKRALTPIINWYRNLPMRNKISVVFLAILVPMMILFGAWFYNVLQYNEHYSRAVRNTSIISEFSIDFKKNYDYKIYLVIIGNKTYDSQKPIEDIASARRIISQVRNRSENKESIQRIVVTGKYLDKLEKYTEQIRQNMLKGGMYDENQQIWERDIQSVTACIQESILEILYYENKQGAIIYSEMQQMTIQMIIISSVIFVFVIALTILIIIIFPRTVTKPIYELSRITERVAGGDLTVRAHIRHGIELKGLGDSLNVMIEKIASLINRVTQDQTSLREAELEILQMQINPHFLYNTLDTIIWMAEAGDKDAVIHMVQRLTEFFRVSLNNGKDTVLISLETRHILSYLEIQKVRYLDILEYDIRIPAELNCCQIPRITLQPLVENALYHGIKHKRERGMIRVSGRRDENYCVLTVEDNGIGMTSERLSQIRKGLLHKEKNENDFYGLYNVNERIRLRFGDCYGLQIDSVYGKGTRIEVWLPFEREISDQQLDDNAGQLPNA
ncbi:MAG: sensor histidine kinase [Roseburia sp.]|nr:sensor histidine kinase [Roseburia sp.]